MTFLTAYNFKRKHLNQQVGYLGHFRGTQLQQQPGRVAQGGGMALSITKATGKARSQLVGLQGLQRLGEEDECVPKLQSSQ